MVFEQWVTFINGVGFPIAIVAVLLYGLWRGGAFLSRDILVPVARKLIEFIEHLQICQTRQTEATETMCGELTELSTTQKEHGELLVDIRKNL